MSRFVHVILFVLAWVTLPLWAVSIAGLWFLGDRTLAFTVNLASTTSIAWPVMYVRQASAALSARSLDLGDARERALIQAIAALAAGPEPVQEAEPELNLLRAV